MMGIRLPSPGSSSDTLIGFYFNDSLDFISSAEEHICCSTDSSAKERESAAIWLESSSSMTIVGGLGLLIFIISLSSGCLFL